MKGLTPIVKSKNLVPFIDVKTPLIGKRKRKSQKQIEKVQL
jgi:hypothetical protein